MKARRIIYGQRRLEGYWGNCFKPPLTTFWILLILQRRSFYHFTMIFWTFTLSPLMRRSM